METTTRTQNCYTNEQIAKLEALVSGHNQGKSFANSYYIVDLTGDKRVYFTLYKYQKPEANAGVVNPYHYLTNLSIDIEEAVVKLLSRANNTAILICYDDNNNPLLTGFRKRTKEGVPVIPFGKYKGMTVLEIWEKDRGWIMWFNKEYKTKPYTDYGGHQRYANLSQEDVILKSQASELIKLFWDEWRAKETEKNKAESTSDYYGQLKSRSHLAVTVTSIKPKDEYTVIYFKDRNGNVLYTYDRGFNLEVGVEYSIYATPTKYVEKLGIKTTYINRLVIEGKTY